jgi:hypothetical protein
MINSKKIAIGNAMAGINQFAFIITSLRNFDYEKQQNKWNPQFGCNSICPRILLWEIEWRGNSPNYTPKELSFFIYNLFGLADSC